MNRALSTPSCVASLSVRSVLSLPYTDCYWVLEPDSVDGNFGAVVFQSRVLSPQVDNSRRDTVEVTSIPSPPLEGPGVAQGVAAMLVAASEWIGNTLGVSPQAVSSTLV